MNSEGGIMEAAKEKLANAGQAVKDTANAAYQKVAGVGQDASVHGEKKIVAGRNTVSQEANDAKDHITQHLKKGVDGSFND